MDSVQLAFRVGVTTLVVVTPTLMFLGFWNVLMAMRDGELVNDVAPEGASVDEWPPVLYEVSSVLGVGEPPESSTSGLAIGGIGDSDGIECRECGATNHPEARICASCLESL